MEFHKSIAGLAVADGGVEQSNAKMICENGATVLVAGNSVFGQSNPEFALKELKRTVGGN